MLKIDSPIVTNIAMSLNDITDDQLPGLARNSISAELAVRSTYIGSEAVIVIAVTSTIEHGKGFPGDA